MAFMTMALLVFVSLTGVIYAGGLTMSELFAGQGSLDLGLTGWCWAMGIMAAIYIAAGGLNASAWADLIQGIALILGGAIITYYALVKLGLTPVAQLTAGSVHPREVADGASGIAKLIALNHEKLHMQLPSWDKNIPWTALVLGLWIPNFYYWGLNQYITQRVLGASSLKQGQRGIVFAAGMKLIIPFVIVVPGIVAFNLYSKELAEIDSRSSAAEWKALAEHLGKPDSGHAFVANIQWARLNPQKAAAIDAHNLAVLKARGGDVSGLTAGPLTEEHRFAVIPGRLEKLAASGGLQLHAIQGYKYDAALNLLMKNLLPENTGVRGFVIAALLGAIVSSLAAVLNAASTIFTMDIYQRYFNPQASQRALVAAGRIAVGIFAVLGCALAPNLDKFGSIFKYIQQFQGYASPGILAVFVFGILNRRGPGLCGVVGLLLNPILYWALDEFTNLAFLDAMGVCFFSVLAVMWLIAVVKPLPQPVVFGTHTTMELESCSSTRTAGIVVVAITVLLYLIFW
jgi:solute:Na+ symporter, SSS family